MSVNLSDRFYDNQYQTGMQSGTSTGNVHASQEHGAGNDAGGLVMQAGQQFRGMVVSVDGEDVVIRMQDDQLFQAHLENGIRLSKGMSLSFEVKGVQNGQISLMPLYSNMDPSSSVSKALDAAGLPITERGIQMVRAMMEQGMRIDTKSLQSMYQSVNKFSMAEPSSIVWMKQLRVPVTIENIEQFENYKNHSAQMLNSYGEIGKQLTAVMKEFSAQGDMQKLGRLFSEVMKAVSQYEPGQNTGDSSVLPKAVTENGTIPQESADGVFLQKAGTENGAVLQEQEVGAERTTVLPETGTEHTTVLPETGMENGAVLDKIVAGKQEVLPEIQRENAAQAEVEEASDTVTAGNKTQRQAVISVEDAFKSLAELVQKKTPESPETAENFYQETGRTVARFLKMPEFEELFKEALSKEWLLKPEEVPDKDKVKEIYRKVLEQTAGLKEALASAGREDASAMKSVQSLSRNVEFLNELNQNFSLLQLPLKMSEQKAHGDLYVYTNKKSMTSDKGAVTALLHLTMDHVGDMDVYVALQNQKVSTKFYLESDEMISFFEEHMDELDRRLAQKGYILHSELLQKDRGSDANVFEEMLKDSRVQGLAPASMVYRQSFDMRA